MTIRESLAAFIDGYAIFRDDAAAILDEMNASDRTGMRWSDSFDDYPRALMAVMRLSTKSAMVSWLKRNKPEHWVLPALESELQGRGG